MAAGNGNLLHEDCVTRIARGSWERFVGNLVDVKELPDDLAQMEAGDLAQQGAVRDERLEPLFRRWPKLSRVEMGKLKALYGERLRIARHLGSLRRGRSRPHEGSK